jgi:hypothetical protein
MTPPVGIADVTNEVRELTAHISWLDDVDPYLFSASCLTHD